MITVGTATGCFPASHCRKASICTWVNNHKRQTAQLHRADPCTVFETSNTYERWAIERWFASGHSNDPLSNKPLDSKQMGPNRPLRALIAAWAERRGIELRAPPRTRPVDVSFEHVVLHASCCMARFLAWLEHAEGAHSPVVRGLCQMARHQVPCRATCAPLGQPQARLRRPD
jgi:hypothetical protein